ncbi:hypothetical protein H0H81_009427 [Sphagnurus paluster]|uniref:Uncharacterized protein n=1 Tax=Sphagnurus paluster TaxID=117069 RepID=A0A9P7K4K9_9AGAR|nr:hypothetical protein H0H81_009427 [Sphagnurus paluster]
MSATSSASARAEARRKAILSRGTDRLAKLTTSARGDDPAYMHDDPPLPSIPTSRQFLGEESSMPSVSVSPPPPHRRTSGSGSPSPSPQPSRGSTPDVSLDTSFTSAASASTPSAWSPEQQAQFLQALMGSGPNASSGMDGMGMFPPMGMGKSTNGTPGMTTQQQPTRLQKLMPFVHLIAMWCMLAYFVFYAEPRVGGGNQVGIDWGGDLWKRWRALGGSGVVEVVQVQFVPFFWAFTTLQIVLHSVRIFSGFDAVQPPTLVALALPHLPPPLPSVIINGMKYLQMGSLFLDDLAGLIVGMGFLVLFSSWWAS